MSSKSYGNGYHSSVHYIDIRCERCGQLHRLLPNGDGDLVNHYCGCGHKVSVHLRMRSPSRLEYASKEGYDVMRCMRCDCIWSTDEHHECPRCFHSRTEAAAKTTSVTVYTRPRELILLCDQPRGV